MVTAAFSTPLKQPKHMSWATIRLGFRSSSLFLSHCRSRGSFRILEKGTTKLPAIYPARFMKDRFDLVARLCQCVSIELPRHAARL